ncbi:hypothetical protein JCM1393_28310 [Clostridium carnis]
MKILFIACYSPLINNSASIETLQYLNNLAKIDGNEVHLLTVNFPKDSVYYDEYIFSMLDKNVKLHIISGGIVFEKIMPRKSNNNVSDSNKASFIKQNLKRAKRIFAIPDMYLYWAYKAADYGEKLVGKEKFDVMFSMHEPPSSHICAYKIKSKFKNLKWVTYWSDPWLKDSTRDDIGNIRRKIEGNFEKKIIELADKFIFVTDANRDDYSVSYNIPREKTFIITRGYDKEVYEEVYKEKTPVLIKNDKINLVYTGEIFSKLRDIKPFINSLNLLKDQNRELYSKLNILFFGNIDDLNIKKDLEKVENATVSGRISYKEALGYMLNGDILLLFGNKNSKQIPAKIYDYFGCNGYILVVLGDENDPIINVVKNKEKCSISKNNELDILESIESLSNKVIKGEKLYPIEEYEWQYISKKLDKILRE